MEFLDDFENQFMIRTLEIIKEYDGKYDATILVNCLLGLLVVPREKSYEKIPNDPITDIYKWGIPIESIISYGKYSCGDAYPKTLRQLVRSLRNSVAHFTLTPINDNGQVAGFLFKDRSGFKAELKLSNLNIFVNKLSEELKHNTSK